MSLPGHSPHCTFWNEEKSFYKRTEVTFLFPLAISSVSSSFPEMCM